jgi:hypothetical protein
MKLIESIPWMLVVLLIVALPRLLAPGGFGRAATQRQVIRRAYSDFPADADLALAELKSYSGPEPDRVMLDILILSAGSLVNLKRWTRRANNDYRDVLSAADGDSEMGAKIRSDFRERTPENCVELSLKGLLDEEPLEGEAGG